MSFFFICSIETRRAAQILWCARLGKRARQRVRENIGISGRQDYERQGSRNFGETVFVVGARILHLIWITPTIFHDANNFIIYYKTSSVRRNE